MKTHKKRKKKETTTEKVLTFILCLPLLIVLLGCAVVLFAIIGSIYLVFAFIRFLYRCHKRHKEELERQRILEEQEEFARILFDGRVRCEELQKQDRKDNYEQYQNITKEWEYSRTRNN